MAVLAGCSVGPSQRPPVAVRGEQLPAPPPSTPAPRSPNVLPVPEPLDLAAQFADCTADTVAALAVQGTTVAAGRDLRFGCGEVDVATDPDQPGLGRTRLGLVRAAVADAPDDRPALLVVGDSGTDPSARHAARLATEVSPAVLARYQLVGLDRRGTGADALDCAPPAARAALVDADPRTTTDAGLTSLLESARSIVQDCYLLLSGSLSSYRSASTAADIEQVRGVLGVARLSAIGVGDGAGALARWATAHPHNVGRLVLDGPPDPALDQPDRAQTRAAAAEGTFDAFATGCLGTGACPLGPDPRGMVTALVERLRSRPLTATDGSRLSAGATVDAILVGLSQPAGWPGLAAALAQAAAGNPDGVLALLDPVLGPEGRFDAALATTCNDTQRRLTPPEVGELVTRWSADHLLFGATFAQRLLACAPWPVVPTTATADQVPGALPILVLATAHDPRAPLEGSKQAAASLRTARLLSWAGAGTGAYPRTPCVTGAVDTTILDGTLPANGTLCPP